MKKDLFILLIFSSLVYSGVHGQNTPEDKGMLSISADVLKAQLGFLASDITEGREAGEKGAYIASEYIASILQLNGIKPGGDYINSRVQSDAAPAPSRSYFQNFSLLKTTAGSDQVMKVISRNGDERKTTLFTYQVDFSLNPSYPPVEIEAPVVFAGYGFKNEKLKYNDFSNLNIKGKFILKISGVPAFAKGKLTADEISNSLNDANRYIREMGAAGVIEFEPTNKFFGRMEDKDYLNPSPAEHSPVPAAIYSRYLLPEMSAFPALFRVFVSGRAAAEILSGTGVVAEEYIKKADNNQSYSSAPESEKTIYLKSDIKTSQIQVRNVIGIIEGNDTNQVIVLGAHYDHMGMSNGYIWNGADDNGSGAVGIMTIARAIMATGKKPDKTIIIALWTAEEEGLLGSRYYVRNLAYPLKNLKLNINCDMISRYISNDNQKGVEMVYTKSYPRFRDITEANIKKYGIDIMVDYKPSDDPPGGSDHRSFVEAGIPVMRFRTSHPPEYHTPSDEVGVINWDIMEKIVRINFANIWDLANSSW
jgi:hypothetical protein